MSIEDAEGKGVMQKIIGARECSKIGSFGVDAKEKGREKLHSPERQRRSKAAHSQKNQKAQQERGIVRERLGEPSKC